MKKLFNPAISLMNKLSYTKKFILIGAIATLCILVLAYQLLQQSLQIMDFSKKELSGVEYINPLNKMIENVQRYRKIEVQSLLGEKIQKEILSDTLNNINNSITQIELNDKKLGETLKTSQEWNDVRVKW